MCKNILFLALVMYAPALLFAQRDSIEVLPQPNQCGILREQQYFNLKGTVEPDELTWVAALRFKNNTRLRCVGALIHQKYVLTTSACFYEGGQPIDTIELGSCSIEGADCLVVRKFEVIRNPLYDDKNKDVTSYEHDIALVRLEEPVKFSRYISPICLPTPDDINKDYVGQHLTVTGLWTKVTKGKVNRKFFALVESLSTCNSDYQEVNEHFICANICDKGTVFQFGSAILGVRLKNSQLDHYYLAGINTLKPKNYCTKLKPNIFVRIDHLVDWITETIIEREIF